MKKIVKYSVMAFALLMCVLLGYTMGGMLSSNLLLIPVAVVALAFSVLLQVVLHELGHLVAGTMSGYNFISFNILGVVIIREDGRIRLKKHYIAGLGGQCIMEPPTGQNPPFALYLAAGVGFNAIFSIAVLPLVFIAGDVVAVVAAMFFAVGMYFAITNGVPMSIGGVPNDIENLFALKKKPGLVKYFFIQLIVANLAYNTRLKDMPQQLFELPPPELNKEVLASSIAMFRFNMLIDTKRFDDARELGSSLAEDYQLAAVHEFVLYNDLLFLELVGENREDEVAKLRLKIDKQIKKAMKDYPSSIRTDYAMAVLHDKDPNAGQHVRQEFERVAKSYAIKPDIESESELLRCVDRALN